MNPSDLLSPAARRRHARLARLRWRLQTRGPSRVKRILDVLVAASLLLLLSPLLLLLALGIKLQDGGPVLFWQPRIGRDGRPFPFPKLRSMYIDAEARQAAIAALNQHGAQGITFKMKNDPRITPLGRMIRRCSLDELPQLWSVVRGHMSLVGPRPALAREVDRYAFDDRARLHALPGLTGLWQVSGRSELPFETQVMLDLEYIRQASPGLDLKLLARTVPAVISGRGAY
ncbi:sugar transferase [Mitsuaria sp. WAJ17]|uniref:sugar transferase n=1 Tax=Mitsuaria sp. WAJ17 TaxID=2761452 RepID=UPI0015FFDAB8|nr:sugar transferase [Mitsuaria sp. WAJ17]MBB2487048.1 sugar transferase [Mitsuaria sp. WAJ17]